MFTIAVALLLAPPPDPEKLVKDLASPRYAEREKASKKLWELGAFARPALVAAANSPNTEARERAADLLDRFDWGVFPDTPADVLALIRQFRSGEPSDETEALRGLIVRPKPALETLRILLTREYPEERRELLFQFLTQTYRQELPRLLVAGKPDLAERLAELSFLGPDEYGHADAAALFHLLGHTPQAIALLKTRVKVDSSANLGLTFAHRFAGDTASARAAAEKSPMLFEPFLEDINAWADLAARPVRDDEAQSVGGLTLFRYRKAGNVAAATTAAAELGKAEGDEGVNRGAIYEAAVGLLLNGRPTEAAELLRTKHAQPHLLADVLAARLEVREALDLVGLGATAKAADDDPQVRAYYTMRKARLLAQLGRTDEAVQSFNTLATALRSVDQHAIQQLLRAEVRAGRFDLAAEHTAIFIDRFEKMDIGVHFRPGPFELLFDDDAPAAAAWWRALRKFGPKDELPGQTMKRVRELLAGSATPPRFDAAMDALKSARGAVDGVPAMVTANWPRAAAAAYRAAGKFADAEREYALAAEATPTPPSGENDETAPRAWVYGTDERFRPWLDYGDFLTDRGRFADAAKQYEAGWKRFPENPLLLYLAGWSQRKAGQDADGRKKMDLAHILPMGHARMRARLLEELIARGHLTEARKERDLVRQTTWNREPYRGNVWNTLARANVVLKDFPAAADAAERSVHSILRTRGLVFVEGTAYVMVPTTTTVQTARGLIVAGKFDAAMTAARECLAAVPASAEVVVPLVMEFDAAGQTKRADELFRTAWATCAKFAAEHPESGWARHTAAAVAVGCRRELVAGLVHAKVAAEREPAVKLYRETLAEAQFRNGDRESALAVMRELARQEWRTSFYRRQLVRYATGEFTSPLPMGEE